MTGRPSAAHAPVEPRRTQQERLFETRDLSVALAAPLSAEDMVVQAMDDASPTKWHLAHVTWFFENFVLSRILPGYRIFDDSFNYCFNSYYESQGPRQPRPIARPADATVGRPRPRLPRPCGRRPRTVLSREEGRVARESRA